MDPNAWQSAYYNRIALSSVRDPSPSNSDSNHFVLSQHLRDSVSSDQTQQTTDPTQLLQLTSNGSMNYAVPSKVTNNNIVNTSTSVFGATDLRHQALAAAIGAISSSPASASSSTASPSHNIFQDQNNLRAEVNQSLNLHQHLNYVTQQQQQQQQFALNEQELRINNNNNNSQHQIQQDVSCSNNFYNITTLSNTVAPAPTPSRNGQQSNSSHFSSSPQNHAIQSQPFHTQEVLSRQSSTSTNTNGNNLILYQQGGGGIRFGPDGSVLGLPQYQLPTPPPSVRGGGGSSPSKNTTPSPVHQQQQHIFGESQQQQQLAVTNSPQNVSSPSSTSSQQYRYFMTPDGRIFQQPLPTPSSNPVPTSRFQQQNLQTGTPTNYSTANAILENASTQQNTSNQILLLSNNQQGTISTPGLQQSHGGSVQGASSQSLVLANQTPQGMTDGHHLLLLHQQREQQEAIAKKKRAAALAAQKREALRKQKLLEAENHQQLYQKQQLQLRMQQDQQRFVIGGQNDPMMSQLVRINALNSVINHSSNAPTTPTATSNVVIQQQGQSSVGSSIGSSTSNLDLIEQAVTSAFSMEDLASMGINIQTSSNSKISQNATLLNSQKSNTFQHLNHQIQYSQQGQGHVQQRSQQQNSVLSKISTIGGQGQQAASSSLLDLSNSNNGCSVQTVIKPQSQTPAIPTVVCVPPENSEEFDFLLKLPKPCNVILQPSEIGLSGTSPESYFLRAFKRFLIVGTFIPPVMVSKPYFPILHHPSSTTSSQNQPQPVHSIASNNKQDQTTTSPNKSDINRHKSASCSSSPSSKSASYSSKSSGSGNAGPAPSKGEDLPGKKAYVPPYTPKVVRDRIASEHHNRSLMMSSPSADSNRPYLHQSSPGGRRGGTYGGGFNAAKRPKFNREMTELERLQAEMSELPRREMSRRRAKDHALQSTQKSLQMADEEDDLDQLADDDSMSTNSTALFGNRKSTDFDKDNIDTGSSNSNKKVHGSSSKFGLKKNDLSGIDFEDDSDDDSTWNPFSTVSNSNSATLPFNASNNLNLIASSNRSIREGSTLDVFGDDIEEEYYEKKGDGCKQNFNYNNKQLSNNVVVNNSQNFIHKGDENKSTAEKIMSCSSNFMNHQTSPLDVIRPLNSLQEFERNKKIRLESLNSTKCYEESFQVYIQALISQALDQHFLPEVYSDQDEYFISNMKRIDDVTKDRLNKCFPDSKSASYSASYALKIMRPEISNVKESVSTFPTIKKLIQSQSISSLKKRCDVCNVEWRVNVDSSNSMSGVESEGQTFDMLGYPYLSKTLISSSSSHDQQPNLKRQLTLCLSCHPHVILYHRLSHIKFHMYETCKVSVNEIKSKESSSESNHVPDPSSITADNPLPDPSTTTSPSNEQLLTTKVLNHLLTDQNWLSQQFSVIQKLWVDADQHIENHVVIKQNNNLSQI